MRKPGFILFWMLIISLPIFNSFILNSLRYSLKTEVSSELDANNVKEEPGKIDLKSESNPTIAAEGGVTGMCTILRHFKSVSHHVALSNFDGRVN